MSDCDVAAMESLMGQPDYVELPCLCCGKIYRFALDSNEANGIFNVFCNGENDECEDRYAASL